MTASVFQDRSIFTKYRCEITFRDKVLGGTPKNPEIIEGWLRTKTMVSDDAEIKQMMLRTLVELGAEVSPDMDFEDLEKASQKLAAIKQTNGFKVQGTNDKVLCMEDRQVKAMLKEAVNVLYGAIGERWGKSRKGPRGFTAERVFISPSFIPLTKNGKGLTQPDGVELLIVHADTPQGPRSSLAYHEYTVGASIEFEIEVLRNELEPEKWPEIWVYCQENGLGACRSQSYGRFDVTKWEEIE